MGLRERNIYLDSLNQQHWAVKSEDVVSLEYSVGADGKVDNYKDPTNKNHPLTKTIKAELESSRHYEFISCFQNLTKLLPH